MLDWLEEYFYKRRLKRMVNTLSIEFKNDESCVSSTVDLGETISFGEAITRQIDSRKDKSMYLTSLDIKI